MTEVAVPLLWSRKAHLSELLDFYRALGFSVTHEQTRPYVYGAVARNGYELHFTGRPEGVDAELSCLVLVDDVAVYHREFTAALRSRFGRVPSKDAPRITRFKPGQSRFTVVDPEGNHVLVIQRDEPRELEYGGSKKLDGLARVLDNVRILRDFKNDDAAARRALDVGLRRYGPTATPEELRHAQQVRAELAAATEDPAGEIGTDADRNGGDA
ncbi:hypothetical protein [Nocardia mikamii]|uniref:hypothetical protein n=1 Tax=Nocardia mikamii TaxID=508464 RepID=UPI0007A48EFE|nr:hypothetical protein [Nocardia mikamii]